MASGTLGEHVSDSSVGPSIRISQLTGARGEPSPAEYRKPVIGTTVLPERSVAIDILVKLHAARDAQPGTFTYTDPGRGAGRLSLEGFDADDVERIDDYFRVAELSREAGFAKAPGQFVDVNVTVTPALRNPVIMIVVGSVLALGALAAAAATVWGPLQASPGQEAIAWMMPVTFLVVSALGVVIVIQHSTRLRWWWRVRALVIARGERMPHGLRLGE